jgi:threonine/homoserine/homoserine lactone efflux protein
MDLVMFSPPENLVYKMVLQMMQSLCQLKRRTRMAHRRGQLLSSEGVHFQVFPGAKGGAPERAVARTEPDALPAAGHRKRAIAKCRAPAPCIYTIDVKVRLTACLSLRQALYCTPPKGLTMSWHVWIAFASVSALIGLVPGPGVASIVGYAVSSGKKTALASVAGIAIGNGLAISLSLAGVGALLAASAMAFSLVKWAGALYLVSIGVLTLMRSRNSEDATIEKAAVTPRLAFFSNMAVGVFHPKTIIFFVAFVPQFIDAHASYVLQASILALTFVAVVGCTDSFYAMAASNASQWLRRPKTLRWSKRMGGVVMIGAGAATAMTRR